MLGTGVQPGLVDAEFSRHSQVTTEPDTPRESKKHALAVRLNGVEGPSFQPFESLQISISKNPRLRIHPNGCHLLA